MIPIPPDPERDHSTRFTSALVIPAPNHIRVPRCDDRADVIVRTAQTLEDFCRACKTDRMHTVIAVDAAGRPLRVSCGYCGSEHNYRGGPRIDVDGGPAPESRTPSPATAAPSPARRTAAQRDPFPTVTERERSAAPIMLSDSHRPRTPPPSHHPRETGISAVAPAEKWRGGTVLRPAAPSPTRRPGRSKRSFTRW